MNRFFDLDNPVMRALSVVADLMILNIWVTICCIPIFTAGAAFTAMHYVLLKMVRGEEGYITKSFFKSFKDNFKQSTGMWLIMLAAAAVFAGDYYIFKQQPDALPKLLVVIVTAIAIILYTISTFVFPLQSHFETTVKTTLKNAASLMVLHIPSAFLMALLYVLPIIGYAFMTPYLYPIIFLFGFSAPGYACAYLYSRIFRQFDKIEEEPVTPDMDFDIPPQEEPKPGDTEPEGSKTDEPESDGLEKK